MKLSFISVINKYKNNGLSLDSCNPKYEIESMTCS